MAEDAAAPETTLVDAIKDGSSAAPQEMDMETIDSDAAAAVNGGKREREEGVTAESSEDGNESKKAKVDQEEKSVEEQRLEKDAAKSGPVALGYKNFETSVQMFDYFFKFLHFWPPNLNVNKVSGFILDFNHIISSSLSLSY